MNNKTIKVFNSRYSIDAIITITDNENLLTDTIISKLQQYFKTDKAVIYFNDITSKHWLFDFKIDNIWFSSTNMNNKLTNVDMICYK